jgi:hypothetical protein
LALELVAEIDHIDDRLADSKARIADAVTASGSPLTDIFGVGPFVHQHHEGQDDDAVDREHAPT